MPDLSAAATHTWFGILTPSRSEAEWPPPFRPLEAQGDALALFGDLGRLLDQLARHSPAALSAALRKLPLLEELQAVLAQAGAARVFRFLHWLDERQLPDSHLVVASLIEGSSPDAAALRATVTGLTRQQLFGRLFAPDRIAVLQAATETALTEPS